MEYKMVKYGLAAVLFAAPIGGYVATRGDAGLEKIVDPQVRYGSLFDEEYAFAKKEGKAPSDKGRSFDYSGSARIEGGANTGGISGGGNMTIGKGEVKGELHGEAKTGGASVKFSAEGKCSGGCSLYTGDAKKGGNGGNESGSGHDYGRWR